MKKITIILITFFALLGCKADMVKQFIDTPQVRGIQLTSFSAADKRAVFDVKLYNPNAFPLPLSALSGQISLNHISIGSVDAKSDSSLPAQAVQLITIPISLDPNAFIEAAKSVFIQRKASYQFSGGVTTPIGKVPFTNTGELSIQDIMSTILR